ncbi:MAG TPA: TIGR04222 domain-containing membrane protein [Polyangiaceae bacterium]
MNRQDEKLYTALRSFELDDPGARFPFSARLSRENRWSRAYTARVIDEYKRFLFLAAAAGHEVTPSEQVDQAWHLHLVYTESYWQGLCGEVLRRPLHHGPTRGGAADRARFRDAYQRTLASYRRYFGEDAPSDIWPDEAQRFADDAFARVNLCHHWLLPKPAWWDAMERRVRSWVGARRRPYLLGLAVAVTGVIGCSNAASDAPSLFELGGPEFLSRWVAIWLASLGVALAYRAWLRRTGGRSLEPKPELDPYELAYLAGGDERVFQAVIASLTSQGLLSRILTKNDKVLARGTPSSDAHPIEHAAHDVASGRPGVQLSELRAEISHSFASQRRKLERLGLTVRESRMRILLLVGSLAPVIGIPRIVIGVFRDKPVSWLVVLVIVSAIIAMLLCSGIRRTRRGDAVLSEVTREHSSESGENVPLAVAVCGLSIFAETELGHLVPVLGESPRASGSVVTTQGSGTRVVPVLGESPQASGGTAHDAGGEGGGDGGGGGCGGCGG